MDSPVALIFNSRSGVGERKTADAVVAAFRAQGIEVRLWTAGRNVDPRDLASEALRAGYRTLVAAGGDGTVSAVASCLVGRSQVLGVLPLGTLNHFAKDLNIPLTLDEAVENLRTGTAYPVDVGEVNGRTFVNTSSLGIYPRLVRMREKQMKRSQTGKWVALFWASLEVLRRFPFWDVRLHIDGFVFRRRTPFVFVGNNNYSLEGLRLGTRESLEQGTLCLAVGRGLGRWGVVKLIVRAFLGTVANSRDFEVLCTQETWVETKRRRLPVSIDGEVLLMQSPLHYRSIPGALRVILPVKEA